MIKNVNKLFFISVYKYILTCTSFTPTVQVLYFPLWFLYFNEYSGVYTLYLSLTFYTIA